MSWLEQTRAAARYNSWMNHKLYELASAMSDSERKLPRGAFFGSIHGTFNHLLLADRAWMLRFTQDSQRYVTRDAQGEPIKVQSMSQELYADFAQLRAERNKTDEGIVAWCDNLDQAALERSLDYKTTNGTVQSHPAWWAVAHFFNHQTHHRGQITTLFTQAGIDPGVTDWVFMLREEAQARP